ncbi:unnamed protein product, partial [Symbiodinium necroappetens]
PTTCRDVEGWTDLSDYPCAEYVQHGWCTSTGAKGPNWADAWGEFDDYWRNGYAAPQACCACGGGQVHSVVGAWQVLHGACTIVDNCIQSPNYPANYSSNGRCAIVTNSSFMAPLQLVDFSTELFYDILTINNMKFSGLRKPSGNSAVVYRDPTKAKHKNYRFMGHAGFGGRRIGGFVERLPVHGFGDGACIGSVFRL